MFGNYERIEQSNLKSEFFFLKAQVVRCYTGLNGEKSTVMALDREAWQHLSLVEMSQPGMAQAKRRIKDRLHGDE